jgi:hypothetical protein
MANYLVGMAADCCIRFRILQHYMSNLRNLLVLFASLALYTLLCYFLHPFLGYMLDSDGIAYLTIAHRVAEGDFLRSVNGLWSPLNSWLLSPFIHLGYSAWQTAKCLNIIFGAIVLSWVYVLLHRCCLSNKQIIPLLLSGAIGMSYFVYHQLFGDILQLIFLLPYLLVLWPSKQPLSISKTIVASLFIVFAFYAKAYSLVFYVSHFFIYLLLLYYQKQLLFKEVCKHYCIGVGLAILCILPWSFAMQKKYGEFNVMGVSGKMNMSWQINSGKSFRSDIKLLIPPSYPDSPSFWEDPYPTQQDLSTPFSSLHHFFRWIARILHTLLSYLVCMQEISFLSFGILGLALYFFLLRTKNRLENSPAIYLLLSIFILPVGYWLVHIETRYIWLCAFLLMALSGLLLQKLKQNLPNWMLIGMLYGLAFSFITFPVLQMEAHRYKNKDLFDMANQWKQFGIKGSFTSNVKDAGRMWVIAYLTGNTFYTIEKENFTEAELIQEMKRYHVKYFVFYF